MPNKLRSNVSGKELVKFFESYGFVLSRKKGSHLVLSRKLSFGNQILVFPEHKIIPKGTLKKMLFLVAHGATELKTMQQRKNL